MPPLVKFAVIRQKHLGNDAEQPTPVDHRAAIIEMPAVPQRRPDDEHRQEIPARIDQPVDLPRRLVEHRILKQQIVDCIGREPEFGEDHQGDPGLVAGGEQAQDIFGIARRVGDRDPWNASADTDELVAIWRKKRGHAAGWAGPSDSTCQFGQSAALRKEARSGLRSARFHHCPNHRDDPEHGQTAKNQQHGVGRADQAVADITDGIAGK